MTTESDKVKAYRGMDTAALSAAKSPKKCVGSYQTDLLRKTEDKENQFWAIVPGKGAGMKTATQNWL